MNNINILSIRPIAETGEAAPAPQRATPFTSQWTPEAMAMLARLVGDGLHLRAVQPLMLAAFGPAMTVNAVRRKGARLGFFIPSLVRKSSPRVVLVDGNGWSAANVQRLRDLVALGQSGSKIAAQLLNARGGPMSKTAVIAKAIRMGLQLTGKRPSKPPRPVHATLAKPPKPVPAPAPRLTMRDVLANAQAVAVEPRHDGAPVGIMELRIDGCRWVIGDPLVPGFGYCGNRQHVGTTKQSPYCATHHARAYRGGNPSEKAAHRVGA